VPSICGQVRARSIVGRGRQANHQELSSLSYAGINDRGGGIVEDKNSMKQPVFCRFRVKIQSQ